VTVEATAPVPAAGAARRSRQRADVTWVAVAVCLAIAALSLLLPSVPTQDSWAWIIWGRQTLHLALDTMGGSSWKPLPVLFTTPFAIFGGAAPALWLLVARAGGLLAVFFAYRVAARLAGPIAGLVAAGGVAALDWLRYLGHGNIEPLSTALALAAIDRHLAGRRAQALVLAFLAALGRPEMAPFFALYALLVWLTKPERRVLVVALVVAVPVLWLGGDWWGSGDPFHGSGKASGFATRAKYRAKIAHQGKLKRKPAVQPGVGTTLHSGANLLLLPVGVAALAGVALAARRRRRDVLALAAGAAALTAIVAGMVAFGYGGSPRFLFPAAAVTCVLAGIAVGWALSWAGGGWRWLAVAALLAAVTLPFAVDRARLFRSRAHEISLRAELQNHLNQSVDRAGGRKRVLALGHPKVNGTMGHALAWKLDVKMEAVGVDKLPWVIFHGPQNAVAPGRPPTVRSRWHPKLLAKVADWRVYYVARIPRGDRGRPRPRRR